MDTLYIVNVVFEIKKKRKEEKKKHRLEPRSVWFVGNNTDEKVYKKKTSLIMEHQATARTKHPKK